MGGGGRKYHHKKTPNTQTNKKHQRNPHPKMPQKKSPKNPQQTKHKSESFQRLFMQAHKQK